MRAARCTSPPRPDQDPVFLPVAAAPAAAPAAASRSPERRSDTAEVSRAAVTVRPLRVEDVASAAAAAAAGRAVAELERRVTDLTALVPRDLPSRLADLEVCGSKRRRAGIEQRVAALERAVERLSGGSPRSASAPDGCDGDSCSDARLSALESKVADMCGRAALPEPEGAMESLWRRVEALEDVESGLRRRGDEAARHALLQQQQDAFALRIAAVERRTQALDLLSESAETPAELSRLLRLVEAALVAQADAPDLRQQHSVERRLDDAVRRLDDMERRSLGAADGCGGAVFEPPQGAESRSAGLSLHQYIDALTRSVDASMRGLELANQEIERLHDRLDEMEGGYARLPPPPPPPLPDGEACATARLCPPPRPLSVASDVAAAAARVDVLRKALSRTQCSEEGAAV
eukprot:TRINITY_DN26553_c0_g2_i1.p1 TRINITY_DN26553_c0_g2~~TRINITY_DN26553_c0_g2_i1.p1  ORF type:complete len:423 (+),score=149.14 TRINITY_DN26553_c0_g2_i1:49-1269(+)